MTIVTGKLIGAAAPARVEMKATLVDVTGKPAVGYVASVPGEVVKAVPIQADAEDGAWEVDLTGNAAIESLSGDTLWAIQEGRELGGAPILTYVVVPESGGPYWVGNIRADLSDTISGVGTVVYLAGPGGTESEEYTDAAVATHSADTTSVHGIADTTALETQTGAQTKATAAAAAAAVDATAKVATHAGATDPHGDRAAAAAALSAHASDSTDVHGIADTTALETTTGAAAKVTAHAGATDPHGDRAAATSALATHAADTTAVHGIADTAALETAAGAASKVSTHAAASDPHGDRAWADAKFALASGLTTLDGTVNDLADSVTALDGFLNDALNRIAAIEQGTAWLGGLNVDGDAQVANGNLNVSGNLAVTGNAMGMDGPAAHGVAAWCYDPALAVNTTEVAGGTLYLSRVNVAADVAASKIYWWVGNSGSSPVSGQCQVGLYDSSGTLLASANVDAAISSPGLKTTAITPQALTAGAFYWVGMVFNASVRPALTRGSGWTGVNAAANMGLTAATSRFATNGTGRTALPASITPGSNVGTDFAGPWVAVGA
ncbi:hypothetical protein ACFQ6Q_00350 [Streptomyces sp. NPDC056437]|uniref:hypothetical protein n=1 Tax=Streptomyces sp. NPDC056437 TaxID=3345816 RepID=UPI0036AD76B3